MKPSTFLNLSASIVALNLSCNNAANAQNHTKPNIIYIFPDQWRGSALGFLKKEPVKTPVLDKLAKESVVFTHVISTQPVCIPYRGMLMTGKYPPSAGIVTNHLDKNKDLPDDPIWISDVLKQNGYNLGYLGKWHITRTAGFYCDTLKGEAKEWVPLNKRHGFDYWFNHIGNDHMNASYWSKDDGPKEFKKVQGWTPYFDTQNAIRYIKNEQNERSSEKPFALFISYNPPHMSYTRFPKQLLEKYRDISDADLLKAPNIPGSDNEWGKYYRDNIRAYYAMITELDQLIGTILETLKENGLYENTIVVFTSDHGNCLGIHGQASKNNLFEESVQVPFFIRWPEKLKPGTTDLLLGTPDIAPTLLGLAGMKKSIPKCMEGIDYSQLLTTGKGTKPSSQYYTEIYGDQAADNGKRGIRTLRYMLVLDKDYKQDKKETSHEKVYMWNGKVRMGIALFDYVSDPYELKNIAGENPELVKKLIKQELIPWLKKIKDPWLDSFKADSSFK